MSHGKQFTLISSLTGPNAWKIDFVLLELGLEYESKFLDFTKLEQKAPDHTKYNPNGRIPTLIDHSNNDFVMWESDAIMLYLVEKYDTERKISVSDFNEKFEQVQWLFFQASGQGPYFGQAVWFMHYHPEKISSAVARYQAETIRVLGVLDGVLSKREWLVGGKCTIADLSFVPWNLYALRVILKNRPDVDVPKDYPAYYKWHRAMFARESVAKIAAPAEAALIERGR
ncbi:glutathione S-transferase, partial [Rhodofomes roseus]